MNKITYEGTKYDESFNEKSDSARVVLIYTHYTGNTAGLSLLLLKELTTFAGTSSPTVLNVRFKEINTSLFFTMEVMDTYPGVELSFVTAISQALQDYLNEYTRLNPGSAGVTEIRNKALISVNEIFLKSILCSGGLFDYV